MGRAMVAPALLAGMVFHVVAARQQLRVGQAATASTVSAPQSVALSASALLKGEDALFKFLRDSPTLTWNDFKPRCLEHVDNVMNMLDRAYTDEQVETVLTHQCIKAEEFPSASATGFQKETDCKRFAKALADARMEEVMNGSEKGYEDFCREYYLYRGGQMRS